MVDFYPELEIKSSVSLNTIDGVKIIHSILYDSYKQDIEMLAEQGVMFTNFLGTKKEDVFKKYPKLSGTKVDEEGNESPIFIENTWYGEENEGDTGYFAVLPEEHSKFKLKIKSKDKVDSDLIKSKVRKKSYLAKQIKEKIDLNPVKEVVDEKVTFSS